MDTYLTALKDILVVATPIVVAYISYRTGKKTQKDITLEVEKITKEKEAETKQILDKINAELESQKQLITWENSMPQTNDYTGLLGVKRFGNISALPKLCQDTYMFLNSNPSIEALMELNLMLDRIELPDDKEELLTYEVPIIMDFKIMRDRVNTYIQTKSTESKQ